MKQKFGIRKTKMNIFWLFIAGLLIGVIIALRQPMPTQQQQRLVIRQPAVTVQAETEATEEK